MQQPHLENGIMYSRQAMRSRSGSENAGKSSPTVFGSWANFDSSPRSDGHESNPAAAAAAPDMVEAIVEGNIVALRRNKHLVALKSRSSS